MIKISVIVPVYNVEKYLDKCLESIVNQTLKEIEIICVNDGSTDGSGQLLKKWAKVDTRIKIIEKDNSGYGHTMNVGMKEAKGEYIGIVESDDFVDSEMFEYLTSIADAQKVDVVKSNYYEYQTECGTETYVNNFNDVAYGIVLNPLENFNLYNSRHSIWSGIYRKTFLEMHDIEFNETPGASYQDTAFMYKVWLCARKIYLVDKGFVFYRQDNMDSSVNSGAKVFCVCDEYASIEAFLNKHHSKHLELKKYVFAMKYRTYMWNYSRLSSVYQYAFLVRMKEEFQIAIDDKLVESQFLSSLEKQTINDIVRETNQYFTATSKDFKDDRLFGKFTKNINILNEGFYSWLKDKDVIIYGAGQIGKLVASKLEKNKVLNRVNCFAVSSMANNVQKINGKPVYAIDTITVNDQLVVLVATKEKDQYEIIKELKTRGYANIVSMDSYMLKIVT